MTSGDLKKLLPKRESDAHKGSFGKVLVIAGSDKYPGAAYLTTAASYRVGAGLVALASSLFVRQITASRISEVVYLELDDVSKEISEFNACLVGPGLGQSGENFNFLSTLFKLSLPSLVVDADGLNFLSRFDGWWSDFKFEGILTPHPGEFSRLTGLSTKEIQQNRAKKALEYAKKWNKIVVLKGARSVVASPKGELYVDDFSSAVLSTAGTGDILAGMIAGFIAQGVKEFEAAVLGVFFHSQAASLLEEELGDRGAVSSDLLDKIPRVLR